MRMQNAIYTDEIGCFFFVHNCLLTCRYIKLFKWILFYQITSNHRLRFQIQIRSKEKEREKRYMDKKYSLEKWKLGPEVENVSEGEKLCNLDICILLGNENVFLMIMKAIMIRIVPFISLRWTRHLWVSFFSPLLLNDGTLVSIQTRTHTRLV